MYRNVLHTIKGWSLILASYTQSRPPAELIIKQRNLIQQQVHTSTKCLCTNCCNSGNIHKKKNNRLEFQTIKTPRKTSQPLETILVPIACDVLYTNKRCELLRHEPSRMLTRKKIFRKSLSCKLDSRNPSDERNPFRVDR